MKYKILVAIAGLNAFLAAQESPISQPTPLEQEEAATARSRALELAGAFSNDGFKLRDGFWAGTLGADRPLFLQVNLFAGNEYWFSAAALPPLRKITLAAYDEKGRLLESDLYEDGPAAAIGFKPPTSGRYFIRLERTEGDKAEFCLVYSYK